MDSVTVTLTVKEAVQLAEAAKHGLDYAYVEDGVVREAIRKVLEAAG
jgi:hypothetical protein